MCLVYGVCVFKRIAQLLMREGLVLGFRFFPPAPVSVADPPPHRRDVRPSFRVGDLDPDRAHAAAAAAVHADAPDGDGYPFPDGYEDDDDDDDGAQVRVRGVDQWPSRGHSPPGHRCQHMHLRAVRKRCRKCR